nr:transportin MOS14 isoform X1 [Ipomoea batatas]
MELQNTVKEALNALYHHPEDTVRMQADRWLQDFQRTIDAWQVADNLLHDSSSNQETLIFCSQTLRSKVQRDFEELPSEAFRPLRDSLNAKSFVVASSKRKETMLSPPSRSGRGDELIASFQTLLKTFHKGPPKVRTQISLAVAALAVHVPAEDWGDGGIVNWLKDGMNSHPEFIPSFLEVLRVLPEEAFNYKIAARPDRRRQFEQELASAMDTALTVLSACLNINELKEQVLEAFASWLRLRHRIPAVTLASHPLVLAALSSLHSDMLLEASVNVVSELIHYTAARNSGGASSQMPLIQVIVPQVMSLKPQLRDPSKVTFRVQYPQDYSDLSREDQKDFKQTRYAVADALIDAALVLGGEATLKILYMKLVEAVSCCATDWRPAEAALYCIRAISDFVSVVDAEVMPQIMSLLPKLPHQSQLLQTVCNITELNSENAKKALEAICLPAVSPLQEIINQGPVVLGQKTARELTVHIDRLANIFRHVNHPEAVADAIQKLWPIFKAIFDIRAWDMRTMESLCRACKNAVSYALFSLGRAYGIKALEWTKECVSLIPSTAAVTELEKAKFLQALSEAVSGANMNGLILPIEEISEVCRRNRTVQEIVQGALRHLKSR